MRRGRFWAVLGAALFAGVVQAEPIALELDPAALAEAVPLALKALEIWQNAEAREEAHAAKLAARGIAEVPASTAAERYTIDVGGLGDFTFDDWGELYIDRRFVTDEEMKTVHAIEAWLAKYITQQGKKSVVRPPRKHAGAQGLPIFRGFEDARYQKHDALIAKLVAAFNANKAAWCGGSVEQAAKIAELTPALVKAHMIEESGGNGKSSRSAWEVDPLQVNVPGDWGQEKELVGLAKPVKRNEGKIETNIKAAIMYLSRKGFSAAAQPAAKRPKGFFDGWLKALQRYNGRRDRTETDRYYSDEYADKIWRRANNPDRFEPIEIKLAK